jgi:hypothetical protein
MILGKLISNPYYPTAGKDDNAGRPGAKYIRKREFLRTRARTDAIETLPGMG